MKNLTFLFIFISVVILVNSKLYSMTTIPQDDSILIAIFTEKIKASENIADSKIFPLFFIKTIFGYVKTDTDPISIRKDLFEVSCEKYDQIISDENLIKILQAIEAECKIQEINLSNEKYKQQVKKLVFIALWDYVINTYQILNQQTEVS